MDKKNVRKRTINEWPRHRMQALWALISNSYLQGFLSGKIYGGRLKELCVPGMNCYSCPGARGACPIGSLQAVIGSYKFKFPYYPREIRLRLALPLRADTGSSSQDPLSEEDRNFPGR